MIRRPPRSTPLYSSAASDVYKRQVDETFLPGWVLLAQHHILLAAPTLIQLAEAAVAVSFRMRLPVLFPDQLPREMTMLLQLLVQSGKVGIGSFAGSFGGALVSEPVSYTHLRAHET